MSLKITSVGIVGQGFVGGGIKRSLEFLSNSRKLDLDIWHYDLRPELANCSLEALVVQSDLIFVCVPTPMNIDNGVCDTSIVEGVLQKISEIASEHYNSVHKDERWNKMKYILIKSTVPPGTTREFDVKYGGPNTLIGFCPEFLTEADADMDMLNQNRIVLGVDSLGGNTLDEHDTRWMDGDVESICWSNPGETISKFFESLYHPKRCPRILETTPEEAELCKYFINCFLATKVLLMNEFKQIADAHDRGWRRSSIYGRDPDSTWYRAIEATLLDPRIGNSHTQIPGPDGKAGVSGHCFPKDLNALINIAKDANVNPKILQAAWQKNLEVRPERDWERLEGRAVTSKKGNEK